MVKVWKIAGLLVFSLALIAGCSSIPHSNEPGTDPDLVRQHADKAFQRLNAEENPPQRGDVLSTLQTTSPGDASAPPARSLQYGAQTPLGEIEPSDSEYIRATGYGALAKGLYLCQHSADLAARVELSKLIRVQVKEKSVDRIHERTGKDAEQDIQVVRKGLVNEVLSDVRIVARTVDKEAGFCASTAIIPRRNLVPTNAGQAGPAAAPH